MAVIVSTVSLLPEKLPLYASHMPIRRVVVLAFPGMQALDVAGPAEVFDTAHRLLDRPDEGYRIEIVSAGGPLVPTCSQITVEAAPLAAADGPIDTLMVPGGWGMPETREDPAAQEWVRQAAARSRRVTSVCGGSFLLGRAGLLAGRRATTHWAFADEFAELCPDVTVDPRPIFVRDGKFTTSAGVSSGIDMTLALVEEDHGSQFALEVARYLVLFFKRPGGQAQFSSALDAQLADGEPIRRVQEWILTNLGDDLSVPVLARRAAMSQRHFARVFQREVGHTPGRYVESVRIVAARKALESTELPVRDVARRCGFPTVETFLRAFDRNLGVTPTEYRSRFHAATPALAGTAR